MLSKKKIKQHCRTRQWKCSYKLLNMINSMIFFVLTIIKHKTNIFLHGRVITSGVSEAHFTSWMFVPAAWQSSCTHLSASYPASRLPPPCLDYRKCQTVWKHNLSRHPWRRLWQIFFCHHIGAIVVSFRHFLCWPLRYLAFSLFEGKEEQLLSSLGTESWKLDGLKWCCNQYYGG